MGGALARKIAARRAGLVATIESRLTADPTADLAAELRDLEAWSKLEASLPPPRLATLFWPVMVAIVAVSSVGLAWSIPRPSSRVVLDAGVEEVSFRTSEPWAWQDTPKTGKAAVRLTEVRRLDLPVDNGLVDSAEGAAWAKIEASRSKVVDLTIAEGSAVTLQSSAGDEVTLAVGNGALAGGIAVWGDVFASWAAGPEEPPAEASVTFDTAETVRFDGGIDAVPTVVTFGADSAVELPRVRVRDLGFAREVAQGPAIRAVVSTILGGSLRLPDTGAEVSLTPGDRLALAGAEGTISRQRLGDGIRLVFEGRAAKIAVGPSGFERDLTPSWLDWLYHNERLLFLWSAVTVVAGLLWSAKRLLDA